MSKSRRPKYGWDTSVFLAWIGQEECYPLDDIALVADEIDASRADLIMSAIVYSEILEAKHSKQQMKQFQMFLKRSNVIVVDVTIGMAQKAAEIRGKAAKAKEKRRLKTPDAIVIATALVYGADVLHSFDPHLVNLSGTAIVDGLKITHPHLITGQRALPGVVASGEDQYARRTSERGSSIGRPLIYNRFLSLDHQWMERTTTRDSALWRAAAPPELMPVTTATQSFRAEESGPEPPLVRLSLVQRLAHLPGKHPSTWAIAALLVLAVGLAFGQTIGFQFVNFDDDVGVYENPLVTRGFTWRGIAAVFSQRHVESWCPLTCVSHILDWQLYRDWAGGHHLTNVLLHAGSAVLLFLALWRMTDKLWASAIVAACFAVHPLHVESVAWVTERKDALGGLCFMLALAAYRALHARHPFSLASYVAVVAVFAVGLAAKPIVITLPFLFLLLDYWPLCRLRDIKPRSSIAPSVDPRSSIAPSVKPRSSIAPSAAAAISVATKSRSTIAALWRLVLEKLPLFVLAAISCGLTVWGQADFAAARAGFPMQWRVGNALISCVPISASLSIRSAWRSVIRTVGRSCPS